MRILLDTHCWLWWLSEPERLSTDARTLIEEGDHEIFLSAASSWEIAIKYALGKLRLPEPPAVFVPARLERDMITALPVQHSHTLAVASLPHIHRDPFDRLLVCQARLEKMALMSVDRVFGAYDVELIAGN